MISSLTVDVVGTPTPQGSKKAFVNKKTGRAQVVDDNKAALSDWRQDVKTAALAALRPDWQPFPAAVAVAVTFYLRRPDSHYGTGRNAGQIRALAPTHPAVKPDLDKLLRSTFDALGDAGVWRDDSRVVGVYALKHYADGRQPGAVITIRGDDHAHIAPTADIALIDINPNPTGAAQ